MKKQIRRYCIFIFFGAMIPSCEFMDECKSCRMMTDNNGVVTKGVAITYCGEKLTEIEEEAPVIVGNTTTYWQCE